MADRHPLVRGLIWVLKKGGQLFLFIVISLTVLELAVRAGYAFRKYSMGDDPQPYTFGHTYASFPPWSDSVRLIRMDPELIWKMRAGESRMFVDVFAPSESNEDWLAFAREFTPEMRDWAEGNPVWDISLNSDGFRNEEFEADPSPDAYRVVCLGDSWTFGSSVASKDTFPKQIESKLKELYPDREIHVANLGIPGHSSQQGLALFQSVVPRLDPDLVVIGYGGIDGQLSGWRDAQSLSRMDSFWARTFVPFFTGLEFPPLLKYTVDSFRKEDRLLGDRLKDKSAFSKSVRERPVQQMIDFGVRVPPEDFASNMHEMIGMARDRGAGVVLLMNDLDGRHGLAEKLEPIYLETLQGVAAKEGVPLVDSSAIISSAQLEVERRVEEELGLAPEAPDADESSAPTEGMEEAEVVGEIPEGAMTDVVFRVHQGDLEVPQAIYIAGTDASLGNAEPNRIAMHDDGTNGDQRAGDGVWSLTVELPIDGDVFFAYTNSGRAGRWEGMDVPHVREFRVPVPDGDGPVYLPIDTFGKVYVQSDTHHPDAEGQGMIAQAIVDAVLAVEETRARVEKKLGPVAE